MATAAQRAWLKRSREQAATGSSYRGPTAAQIKAGTLAVGTPSTSHRKSARTTALTRSGIRAGQTPAQAAAESTKAVYGTQSAQAKQAQATLINEQRIAASRRSVIKDLRGGVIGGVKVIQTPPPIKFKTPYGLPPVDPHIHVRTETLIGKKAADYPTVASQIKSMQESQRSAYRQLQSDASKLQKAQSQLHIAEQRLNKAPIKDGVFVGTEAQYNKYITDYKTYTNKHKEVDTAINKYNSDIRKTEIKGYKLEKLETKTRRAQYGGLVGKYEDIETKVSKKIPTLYDISRKGAEFRREHPEAANKLYTTFQKAHAKTEKVGTIEQRNALAGYTYGSYQSLQKQPVKTAAMFAAGGASVKAIRMVGLVGKAFGAGLKAKRMAQAAQFGIVGYYGYKSTEYVMSAPNSYVAGQRAAKIMYTEVLPLVVGARVVELAPKVTKPKITEMKPKVQKTIKTTIKTLEVKRNALVDKLKIGKRKGTLSKSEIAKLNRQVKTYNGRLHTKRKELLDIRRGIRAKLTEIELKQQALEGKTTLTNTEMDKLVSSFKPREFGIKKMPAKTVSKFNKLKHDIKYLVPKIKALKLKITRGKGLSEKQLSKLQSDLKLSDARLMSKREEMLNIRKQIRSKLTEIELKQRALEAEEYIPLTDANMKTMLDLFKSMKKPKIKDVGKEFRAETAKKEAAVKRGELLEIRQKDGTIALQKVVQKQKQVTKTVTKVKTEVETATKTAQKVKAEVRTATKLKIETKAQQKTKLRSLIALRITAHANVKSLTNILTQLKVATTEMQKIETAPKTRRKVVASMSTAMKTKASTLTELDIQKRVVMKAIAEQKAAAKQLTRATELVEEIKFKIPPIIPKKKIPTKKKITKKQREVMILKQKNLNAVATFRDLLGGL